MIEAAVRSLLVGDPVVYGLVGQRIYSGTMPQAPTLPLVTLTKIDKTTGLTVDGAAAGPSRIRIQVDCWDDDLDGVRTLARAVNGADDESTRGPLHGFAGLTPQGTVLKLVELLVERSTQFESETELYRVSADFAAHL